MDPITQPGLATAAATDKPWERRKRKCVKKRHTKLWSIKKNTEKGDTIEDNRRNSIERNSMKKKRSKRG